ncbi:MAG: radical SAM (seleno)protein TrsS [Clostridiaceae bacterium]
MNLKSTISLCPVCLERIEADYTEVAGQVRLVKTCPTHGTFSVPVWDEAKSFLNWVQTTPAQSPVGADFPIEQGCPYDCGLCADHQQASCCVLLEVTARCNLRCPICFASAGETPLKPDPDLTTIRGWYAMLLEKGGPFNIQLSGGEPTMRDDLAEIIALGKTMGFHFFQLNTNGIRLAKDPAYLYELVQAGLSTVFLQFDTLEATTSVTLRGKDLISLKQLTIDNCAAAGIGVVLVPTLRADLNLKEVGAIVDYAATRLPTVRGVHFQPMSFFGRYDAHVRETGRVTIPMLLSELQTQTSGRIRSQDFSPGSAEHSLCTFYADYQVDGNTWRTKQRNNGGCCSSRTSDQARDVVAQKWSAPINSATEDAKSSRYDVKSLDDFLWLKQVRTLAISGMAFQDAWTIDLERLRRCHVHVVSPDANLVPFCAYNLTDQAGRSLYRPTIG